MDRDLRKELRRNQILDAALHLLVKKGYSETRVDDIVKASGLSKGAIYWYYSSKKEIFISLIDYWVNQFSSAILEIVSEDIPASELLKRLGEFFSDSFIRDKKVYQAELEFWALSNRDAEIQEKTQTVYHNFMKLLEKIIIRGIESGEFKNVDPRITALSIMINLEGIIWFTIFNVEGLSVKNYTETVLDFVIHGLKKRTA
ncbi:MAG: TetR/AcrR family transcriptional regulator [Fidelibacterota bacterium]